MEFIVTVFIACILVFLWLMYMSIEKSLDDILDELKKQTKLLRNLNDKGE